MTRSCTATVVLIAGCLAHAHASERPGPRPEPTDFGVGAVGNSDEKPFATETSVDPPVGSVPKPAPAALPPATAPAGRPAKADSSRGAAQPSPSTGPSAGPAVARGPLRYDGPRDIRRILGSRIPEVEFDAAPLKDVLNWVQDYSAAMVNVRWGVLEPLGLDRQTPITLKARDQRLSQVLWAVLDQAGCAAGVKLAYEASADFFLISTHADLSSVMVVKVYDVHEFLLDIPWADSRADPFHPQPGRVHRTRVRRTILAPQPSLGGGSPVTAVPQRVVISEDERLQEFMELILNSVEPESWEANGYGGKGTIFPYKGLLIVRNSRYVHQLIEGALEQPEK